jgi:hypothetical protein
MRRIPGLPDSSIINRKLPNPKRRIEIEIGDSKQPDFYPQFKTKHWDNECNFSIRLKDDTYEADNIRLRTRAGKQIVEWQKGIKTARFYELDGFEDGGFEIEVEFSEKPDTNVIEYTLETKELDLFYQPPLTQEEIDAGSIQPDDVVGSYAAYHKTKKHNRVGGKEYRTGKAFHIYRPKAVDSNGTEVWCELNIDDDLLTVTVPQEFLDTAVYPVIVDPTFGYTSAGIYAEPIADNFDFRPSITSRPRATVWAPGIDINVISITGHVYGNGTNTINQKAFIGEADIDDDKVVNISQKENTSVSNTKHWETFVLSSAFSVDSTKDYALGLIGDGGGLSSSRSVLLYYDLGNGYYNTGDEFVSPYSSAMPDPWNLTYEWFGPSDGQISSIYATYEFELTPGTYYWRVRGKDPSGSNNYGDWSATREFTVSVSSGTFETISKNLAYAAVTTDTKSKNVAYSIQTTTGITKNLAYEIFLATTETVTKNLSYSVTTVQTATKNLAYTVTVTDTAQKDLAYRVQTTDDTSKNLAYSIQTTDTEAKNVAYTVVTTSTVTKNLEYAVFVATEDTVEKALQYAVTRQQTEDKDLAYRIALTDNITKNLAYTLSPSYQQSKNLTYTVTVTEDVQKNLAYRVIVTDTNELDLGYAVATQDSQEKDLAYRLAVAGSVTKDLEYAVVLPEQDHVISKGLSYWVLGQQKKILIIEGEIYFRIGKRYIKI